MSPHVDLYGSSARFTERVQEAIREETFGRDIGQKRCIV
jgi:hypothetical protein